MQTNNKIWLFVGPSGTGKTTLLKKLASENVLREVIGFTTRQPREDEVNGGSYKFISLAEFNELLTTGGLAEYVEFGGNFYGMTREQIETPLAEGPIGIVVEPHGVEQLQTMYPGQVRVIFLMPPSRTELKQRLEKRGMTEDQIADRSSADDEILAFRYQANYWIEPGDLDWWVMLCIRAIGND